MNKNKGFSLVELIVVVAIMAVLVGILAPAYLSYVEKTRRGADEDMAEEVRHSVEVAAAEICVYDEIVNLPSWSFTKGNAISTKFTQTNLQASMADVYAGKNFDIKSKYYSGKTYTITVTAPNGTTGAALVITGAWS